MFRLLSVISSLFVFLSSHGAHAEPQHWLAKKGGIEYMIIGSVHVGDSSMYPLPKAVTQFLDNSDGLIIEANIHDAKNVIYPAPTIYAKDVLSKKERIHLAAIATELGFQEKQLLDAPPWASALTIQMSLMNQLGYKPDQGVDMHLIGLAETKHIDVIPLESLQFQIDLLTGQPDGGKELLLASIDEFDGGEKLVQCLIDSWKSGDGQSLKQVAMNEESSDTFNEEFLYARNRDWAEKLTTGSVLPQKMGRYTIVVGSLHLLGKDNLIELLEKQGFNIEPLGKTHKVHCDI